MGISQATMDRFFGLYAPVKEPPKAQILACGCIRLLVSGRLIAVCPTHSK